MRARIVSTIVRKDLTAFSRDRFFVLMTVLGIITYAVVFWLLPSGVDETLSIGVHHTESEGTFASVASDPGFDLEQFNSRDDLAEAVARGEPVVGIAFPSGFASDLESGREVSVEVIIPSDLPRQFRFLAERLVDGVAVALAGDLTPSQPVIETTVLGRDRAGDQVSLREQMRPLLAFFILMVETFALASLVATEVQGRTVVAVLTTPATIVDFLVAKGLLGTMLAFGEAALLLAIIGGLAVNAPLMLLILLLGAVLVTGLGMVAGSYGRDFLSVLFISMVFMIPLMIPAFGVLFPGSSAVWVEALPSHGLVDSIVQVTVDEAGIADIGAPLALLSGWCVVLFTAGVVSLKRRVAAL